MSGVDVEGPIHKDETWKRVPGFEDLYEVSDLGRVRSTTRTHTYADSRVGNVTRSRKGRILSVNESGKYRQINLYVDGCAYPRLVSGLVAAAFIGPRPKGQEVCHWDGQTHNDRLENLRYDTKSGNAADKVRHGTTVRESGCCKIKVPDNLVPVMQSEKNAGASLEALAEKYGISRSQVWNLVSGKQRRHLRGSDDSL